MSSIPEVLPPNNKRLRGSSSRKTKFLVQLLLDAEFYERIRERAVAESLPITAFCRMAILRALRRRQL